MSGLYSRALGRAVEGLILALLLTSSSFLAPAHTSGQELFQALARGDRARVEALVLQDSTLLETPGPRGLAPVDMAFMQDCQRGGDLTEFLMGLGAEFDADRPLYGRPKILLASTFGSVERVRFLLDLGVDLEARGPSGGTVLDHAARRGHTEIVEMLLASGSDPNTRDGEGNFPLRWAVEKGHLEVVKALIGRGSETDWTEKEMGMSPLHLAAVSGHLEVARVLLEEGVAISPEDDRGHTPLSYAARYGHRSVRDLLLSAGADPREVDVEREHPSTHLARGLDEGEGVIWDLANRGMALKTRNHLLVFDSEEFGITRPTDPGLANGFLSTEEVRGEDLVAFYGAYHGDVDEPTFIHGLADSVKSATYVHLSGDRFRGSDHALFLDPHETAEVQGVQFTTVAPMVSMATLAYLMRVDGLQVFYQGFGPDDLDHYRSELSYLKGEAPQGKRGVDVAFLHIPDAGLEGAREYFGIFLEEFHPEVVALYTPPHLYSLLPGGRALLEELGFQGRVFFPTFPGDEFVVGGSGPT